MVFSVMGFGVAGGLKLMGFDFWFCAMGLSGFRGGFWVDFGGGLAHGGL